MAGTRLELYGDTAERIQDARDELEHLLHFNAGLAYPPARPEPIPVAIDNIEVSGVVDFPQLNFTYTRSPDLHDGRPCYRHDERDDCYIHFSEAHGTWLLGSSGPPQWEHTGSFVSHDSQAADPVSAFRQHAHIVVVDASSLLSQANAQPSCIDVSGIRHDSRCCPCHSPANGRHVQRPWTWVTDVCLSNDTYRRQRAARGARPVYRTESFRAKQQVDSAGGCVAEDTGTQWYFELSFNGLWWELRAVVTNQQEGIAPFTWCVFAQSSHTRAIFPRDPLVPIRGYGYRASLVITDARDLRDTQWPDKLVIRADQKLSHNPGEAGSPELSLSTFIHAEGDIEFTRYHDVEHRRRPLYHHPCVVSNDKEVFLFYEHGLWNVSPRLPEAFFLFGDYDDLTGCCGNCFRCQEPWALSVVNFAPSP
eukprot:TRINITY_DN22398_c0_g2_i2.p1 TRINITY_DN22398_c0_g2~~TRINITY_DN22398_c0_g2_i2.p1  ORF type:complete len:421 (-),score=8.04 TRINITY_DN22398_c0_g2_i2:36-1298(-)